MEKRTNLLRSLLFCIRFEVFVEQSLKSILKEVTIFVLFARRRLKMKIVVVLFVFLLARSIIIHAEKEYSCSHVNATFGVPVGSVSGLFWVSLNLDCTGTFVSTVPLDACGEIKSNLTKSVALIIKNATSIGCSAAKQVYNVRFERRTL